MSRTAHKLLAGSGGAGAYEIEQSCRFNYSNQAYLSRTPSSTGNQRTWSLSFWAKIAYPQNTYVFNAGQIASTSVETFMLSGGWQDSMFGQSYSPTYWRTSTVYDQAEDPSAWYHIFHIHDTTQSTAANRTRTWINGVEFVMATTDIHSSFSYPDEDEQGVINTQILHRIGGMDDNSQYMDGNLAEFHFIDGTVKAVGDFGETDSVTGQWIPKEYTGGSYGTNGFYLKFESGAIGTDSSGQGNNWTANNIANSDILLDSPTNNFATMNPLIKTGADGITFKEGGLQPVSGGAFAKTLSTFAPESGKWYCEYHVDATHTNFGGVGATTLNDVSTSHIGYSTGETHWIIKHDTATSQTVMVDNVATGANSLGSVSVGDIIGLSLDADNGKIYFRKNNAVIGTSTGYAITDVGTGNYWFAVYLRSQGAYGYGTFNFGQDGTFAGAKTAQGNADGNGYGNFYYSPPSGFVALCTKNLPEPAVKKSTEYFNPIIYTGSDDDSVSQSVTGVGFQPDLVWIKKRNATAHHVLTDAVRGVTKTLNPNQNVAEVDDTYGVTAFGTDGFTVREQASAGGQVNTGTLVSWSWKANGSGSANTQGDIDSTVSVNNDAGFSIVTYTGNRTGAGVSTVGHGLSVAPKLVITKSRSNATNWWVQHPSTSSASHMLNLNGTAAETDKSSNGTLARPTSTVFGTNWTDGIGTNSHTHVAYCFAEVEGFSKFGAYTGNGSTDGPFVHLGFRPALVIVKGSEVNYDWLMFDNKRDPDNSVFLSLVASTTAADYSHEAMNFLSNGFKLKSSSDGNSYNKSGQTLYYAAWAESPFQYSNAR